MEETQYDPPRWGPLLDAAHAADHDHLSIVTDEERRQLTQPLENK
jgi:hypothetical protein